jgi:hypothetical protein
MQRIVHLNPIEPAPFSGRAAAGFDCPIDITYRDVADQKWTIDMAASLVLTGRTTERSISYIVPATDTINGKARVVIPGTDLQDPNGYDMTLVGSIKGGRSVLATGVLVLSEIGIPDLDIVDIIDTVDIALNYDEVCELDVTLWQDTSSGIPYDLTANSTTVQASIQDVKGGGVLMPFTVLVLDVNKVRISLTVDQVNTLPASCWWSLVAGLPTGSTTLCEGTVTVTGTITPPLPTIVYNYDYQKPAGAADPTSGQLVHSNIAQGTLKLAKVNHDSVDVSATLALLRAGDQIIVGATTWTLKHDPYDMVGWYELDVLPMAQDAIVGVTAVTLQRPVS